MSKIFLAYVPVIHKGYLDVLFRHTDAEIYLWGDSLIALQPSLRKEVRSLSPIDVKIALNAILGTSVKIAEVHMLQDIAKLADPLVMPNDVISHKLLENALLSMCLKSYQFEPVFLRWDNKNALAESEIKPDEEKEGWKIKFFVDLAKHEAQQSSDWWRQVGAVLFDASGNVYFSAHNHHLPTDYTPFIDGDPRAAFSKGVNIELSTAIHAEAQVLAKAAKNGISTAGKRLLVTTFPCPNCAKLIAECGISELWYQEGYAMVDGERVLRDADIKIVRIV